MGEKRHFKIAGLRGFDASSPPTEIEPDKAQRMKNFMPIIGNRLKKVPGYTNVTLSVSLGSNIVRAYTFYVGAASGTAFPILLMFLADGKCYSHNINTGTTTQIYAAKSLEAARAVQWKQERALIIDPDEGLLDWDGTTAATEDATITGNFITVFQGYVWILKTNTNTILNSAPDDYTSFATLDGGGSKIANDPYIRGNLTAMVPSQSILYVFAETATYAINNVQTTGGNTLYNFDLLHSHIGCNAPDSAKAFGNVLYTKDVNGIWEISGYSKRRISEPDMDNWLQYFDASFPPVGFIGNCYRINFYGLLAKYALPGETTATKRILAYYNQGWFEIDYTLDSTFVTDVIEIGGNVYNFGIDGETVRNFFDINSEVAIAVLLKSKSETANADIHDKEYFYYMIELSDLEGQVDIMGVVKGNVDVPFTVSPNFNNNITWINDTGGTVQWQNDSSGDIIWVVGVDRIMELLALEGRGRDIAVQIEESSATLYSINRQVVAYEIASDWGS